MIGRLSSMKTLRLVLSLSLVLWVGGAGCVFGCQALAMAADDQGAAATDHSQTHLDLSTMVSGEACASAADHNCCAKHHASSAQQVTIRSTKPRASGKPGPNSIASRGVATSSMVLALSDGAMHTCPLAMNATALATKARSDESTNSVAQAPFNLPAIDLEKPTTSFPPTFCNNRGHTYLRGCVFLI